MFAQITRVICYITFGLLLQGCIAHKQYRVDYAPCERPPDAAAEVCEKSALQRTTNADGSNYLLGFIEFDDQGQLWDRHQMAAVLDTIATQPRELLMVVFVHGWKHSAAADDRNVEIFRNAMARPSSNS